MDAGTLCLNFCTFVPHLRGEAGMAGRQPELSGFYGGPLCEQDGRWADVFYRHRPGQPAAAAPLLFLGGLILLALALKRFRKREKAALLVGR